MGVAAAIAGAAVVGAGASIISGNKAAGAAQYAADKSNEVEKYMYDTTRADYAPYRAVGYNALGKLAGLYGVGTSDPTAKPSGVAGMAGQTFTLPGGGTYTVPGQQTTPQGTANGKPDYGGFYASPSYQFRLNEGIKAIERSAAARGNLRGGATMKALNNYAQDTASNEFDTYANRLAALAGVGQTATGSTAAAGSNYANAASNAYTNAGNARASAYENTGNAINGGINNLASAYLYTKGYGGGGWGGKPAGIPGMDYGIGSG